MSNYTGRGGMPRLAHAPERWDREAAKRNGYWGCWSCGSEDSRVMETDKDDEGIRVRRRQCIDCGKEWETEERRITPGSFFGRAIRRRWRSYIKKRSELRQCKMCREMYPGGDYQRHVSSSEAHQALVVKAEEKRKRRMKQYGKVHHATIRRAIRFNLQLAAEKGRARKCRWCHGLYPAGAYADHVKTSNHRRRVNDQHQRPHGDPAVRPPSDHAQYRDSRLPGAAELRLLGGDETARDG